MKKQTKRICAKRLKRNWLGIDLNPKYVEPARRRFGWCFQNKKTGVLEPHEQWIGGYGLHTTKKDLMDNVWNESQRGYAAVKVEIILKLLHNK